MDLPERKPIRLRDYDYSSPGAYFITVCTRGKECFLSHIKTSARYGVVGAIHESPTRQGPASADTGRLAHGHADSQTDAIEGL